MKVIASAISRPQLSSPPHLATRLSAVVAFTKSRVMGLAAFTAFVGWALAPHGAELLRAWGAFLAIAAGAGVAGALNMSYDMDIHAIIAGRRSLKLRFRR